MIAVHDSLFAFRERLQAPLLRRNSAYSACSGLLVLPHALCNKSGEQRKAVI